jgi:hypothetical protein
MYIQTHCGQVVLQLRTILLKEKIICKDSKNCNSKMWDVMTHSLAQIHNSGEKMSTCTGHQYHSILKTEAINSSKIVF